MISMSAKIARRLVREAPPGQLREVLAGVRALVSAEDREAVEAALPDAVADAHAREYAVVQLPSGAECLLTPDGRRPGTPHAFFDPASRQLLEVDFGAAPRAERSGTAVCTGVAPTAPAHVALLEPAERLRACVERALGAYVRAAYGPGPLSVYGSADEPQLTVVACYGARSAALANFHAGGLCARWQLVLGPGARAQVCGRLVLRVHSFEEGNVQLRADQGWQAELKAEGGEEQLARELVELIRASEGAWHERLLDAFADLGEHAIRTLRRPLPVTRTKFDWERAAQHELADQLARTKV